MTKAITLTRAKSKSVRPVQTPRNAHHTNAAQTNFESSPQPPTDSEHFLHFDERIIGLALGSPRQIPILAYLPDDRDVDVTCVCSSPQSPASTPGNVCEIGRETEGIKRKGSKWKSLGSFFSRREIRPASPFCQLDQQPRSEPNEQISTQGQLESNALRRKRTKPNYKGKSQQVDSSTAIAGEGSGSLQRRTSSRRMGLRQKVVKEPQPERQPLPTEFKAHAIAEKFGPHREQQSLTRGSPFLQVEIPCTELERYSVMFGDVLKPQTRESKPHPSLQVHWRAQLERPQAVADSNNKVCDLRFAKIESNSSRMSDSLCFLTSQAQVYERT